MSVAFGNRVGAWVEAGLTCFRVWAPRAAAVEVVVEPAGPAGSRVVPLTGDEDGYFCGATDQVHAGDRYKYRLDGGSSWPDPASRFQPEGVHGPSEIIDASRFARNDAGWQVPDRDRLVIYELHVGTFSPEGTYAGVIEHLPDLVDLGVTVIELLPLNACDGRWNWGYDGAALFAPSHHYGRPDELRRLVDRAHALGLGVILDVVYNHLGPAGNYTGQFSDHYVRPDVSTAWGPAIDIAGDRAYGPRGFFMENAIHWARDYHFDGFRLDATHAFVEGEGYPFVSEFVWEVRGDLERNLIMIAEDHRNLNTLVRPHFGGGWGCDGVWADDFHHIMRRYLTGDHDGVFQDFAGTVAELVTALNRGWVKMGEWSDYRRKHRGTDPTGLAPERFVFCLQNHDRVGNRGAGDRLNHAVDAATYRAATALLLLAPQTPMLFMGQEWGASTPFLYFTDHAPELGDAIRAGRAREFQLYDDFRDPARLAAVPDPQAESTFRRSVLDWPERDREPHAAVLRLHQALLQFRRDRLAPSTERPPRRAEQHGPDTLAFWGVPVPGEPRLVAIIHLRGRRQVDLGPDFSPRAEPTVLLSTEAPEFVADDPAPIRLEDTPAGWVVHFHRPGALILAGRMGKPDRPDPYPQG